jgi:hypothetical protein
MLSNGVGRRYRGRGVDLGGSSQRSTNDRRPKTAVDDRILTGLLRRRPQCHPQPKP